MVIKTPLKTIIKNNIKLNNETMGKMKDLEIKKQRLRDFCKSEDILSAVVHFNGLKDPYRYISLSKDEYLFGIANNTLKTYKN